MGIATGVYDDTGFVFCLWIADRSRRSASRLLLFSADEGCEFGRCTWLAAADPGPVCTGTEADQF